MELGLTFGCSAGHQNVKARGLTAKGVLEDNYQTTDCVQGKQTFIGLWHEKIFHVVHEMKGDGSTENECWDAAGYLIDEWLLVKVEYIYIAVTLD